MKRISFLLLVSALAVTQVIAQTNTFPSSGNVGVGTTTPSTLFQVNGGISQFGGPLNYARFLIDGDLIFTGASDYLVGGDRYAFRYSGNQNYGLYFSSTNSRFEFRDGSAAPVMWITGGGNIYVKNRIHIGSQVNPTASLEITPSNALAIKINPYGVLSGNTGELRMLELASNGNQFVGFKAPNSITTSRVYTLPANDGTSGQILSTNGIGELSWISDGNTIYTAGSGLNLSGNIFSNTAPDQIVTLLSGGIISISGSYPNFTISAVESDPMFSASPSAGINAGDIANWNTAYSWGDHAAAGYLTSYTETDPIFNASPSATIDGDDITNWNTAYSWGDHAAAGYLTSYSETDPKLTSTTTNAIPKWNGAALVDGIIYDNGTNVGIGTTSPTYKLEVTDDIMVNGVPMGKGAGSSSYNVRIGMNNLSMNTYGEYNTAIGTFSLMRNTTGNTNTAVGYASQYYRISGSANTSIGNGALYDNSAGNYNTAIGEASGRNNQGSGNVFIGYQAGFDEMGSNKLYIANSNVNPALIYGDFASARIGLGTQAPDAKLHIAGNIKIADGTQGAGKVLTSDADGLASWQPVAFTEADPQVSSTTINKVPKWNGTTLTDGQIYDDGTQVGIGTNTPAATLDVRGNAKFGATNSINIYEWDGIERVGIDYNTVNGDFNMRNPSGGRLLGTIAIGGSWGIENTTGTELVRITGEGKMGIGTTTPSYKLEVVGDALINGVRVGNGNGNISTNTAVGLNAMSNNTSGNYNTAVGEQSLASNTTGYNNAAFGRHTLMNQISGSNNTALGASAMWQMNGGNNNIAVGTGSMLVNTTGSSNTAIGTSALYNNNAGSSNTVLGFESGFTNNGSGNVFLGNQAGYYETGSNKLYIANSSANPPLIYGDFSSSKIGINTNNPAYSFDMNIGLGSQGALRVYAGPGGNGRILLADEDVNHGMYDYAHANNVFGNITAASDYGGLGIIGVSGSSDVSGLELTAAIGGADPNDATPVIQFTGNKRSGSYVQALGSNETVLGVRNYFNANSFVIMGNGNVGIKNVSPSASLDITGNVKIADGTQGAGKVLTSDANGLASWQTVIVSETDPKVSSATSNIVPKWNGTALVDGQLFDNGTQVGIGTTTPTNKLDVVGNATINGLWLGSGTGGEDNTVFGRMAFNTNVSGSNNTAIGSWALRDNSSGNWNTALGLFTLPKNTNGNGNTAIGCSVMALNTSGVYNTATGHQSLYYNSLGGYNTATGLDALFYNSTGGNNTAFGSYTLMGNTVGSNNTAIGYGADVSANSLINATALGYSAIVDASNKVRIGNTSVTSIGGEVGWTSFSDERMKKDIRNDVPGLAFINQLKPVTYHIDVQKQNALMGLQDTMQWNGKYDIENITFTGFLAQDVEEAAQNIGYDFSGIDNTGKLMGLRYGDFVVPLTKAAQELDAANKSQDDEIAILQETILSLQQQINDLTALINNGSSSDGAAVITTGQGSSVAMLGQNVPNPYDQSTLIPFRIPKNCRDANIMITDPIAGRVITVIPISCSETHIVFEAGELPSGTYTYTLMVDGQIIDSKAMILTK